MGRVLLTGMSGVGKSTVIAELTARGVLAVDTDDGQWKTASGEWDLHAVRGLLDAHADIVVAGTVDNQGMVYDLFDHIVLLAAPTSVMIERVMQRTDNPYGSSAEEREEILEYTRSVEPLLRATATEEIDTTQPLDRTVEQIEHLLSTPRRFT
ncbi:AAA family ATPase [Microbacterium sp. NPDC089696]|uniref:AAA family ATPase n=1 Tax=Microbacterium sp. NPDC089696 TaxID=3364199 RepID=UPI00381CB293